MEEAYSSDVLDRPQPQVCDADRPVCPRCNRRLGNGPWGMMGHAVLMHCRNTVHGKSCGQHVYVLGMADICLVTALTKLEAEALRTGDRLSHSARSLFRSLGLLPQPGTP